MVMFLNDLGRALSIFLADQDANLEHSSESGLMFAIDLSGHLMINEQISNQLGFNDIG